MCSVRTLFACLFSGGQLMDGMGSEQRRVVRRLFAPVRRLTSYVRTYSIFDYEDKPAVDGITEMMMTKYALLLCHKPCHRPRSLTHHQPLRHLPAHPRPPPAARANIRSRARQRRAHRHRGVRAAPRRAPLQRAGRGRVRRPNCVQGVPLARGDAHARAIRYAPPTSPPFPFHPAHTPSTQPSPSSPTCSSPTASTAGCAPPRASSRWPCTRESSPPPSHRTSRSRRSFAPSALCCSRARRRARITRAGRRRRRS